MSTRLHERQEEDPALDEQGRSSPAASAPSPGAAASRVDNSLAGWAVWAFGPRHIVGLLRPPGS